MAFPSGLTAVGIEVKVWKVAGRHINADPMPALKRFDVGKASIRMGGKVDRVPSGAVEPGVPISAAQDSVGQVHRKAFRKTLIRGIHVEQFEGEVGVGAWKRSKPRFDRARHLDIRRQRPRRKNQHVSAPLQ